MNRDSWSRLCGCSSAARHERLEGGRSVEQRKGARHVMKGSAGTRDVAEQIMEVPVPQAMKHREV